MPRSIARLSAARAFSSSSYMRKRLPQPKARIETFALVRPRVRVGSDDAAGGCATARAGSERVRPAGVGAMRLRDFLGEGGLLAGLVMGRLQGAGGGGCWCD